MQIHLIANAHLDPVWLWDWREGLNEGLTTVRTILNLMDEDEDVTFVRGESSIYQHIEETDPATFQRIVHYVENGRWDIVGGTYVQPDTNLAGTETLVRQYMRGQRYFQSRFGRRARVAWQADSFGHTAGMPEIFNSAGIDSFAFTRPDNRTMPMTEPAFWWQGQGGSRVLAYRPMLGWYGTNRDEIPRRLDALLEEGSRSKLETIACFYGLGNHGGGPSRELLKDIRTWAAAHPDVTIIHSGLHRFFDALRLELKRKGRDILPVRTGELNYCLRGCYSSVARFKFPYRRAEALLARAEKTYNLVAAQTHRAGADLDRAWDGVLFNSFHDILPGSSIERAMQDQIHWVGSVLHDAQRTEFRALNMLASQIDTRLATPPVGHPSGVACLVWNPHPHPFTGHVELEACMDYRPVGQYHCRVAEMPVRVLGPNGIDLPHQVIETENRSMVDSAWRKRVVVPVTLPAAGWNMLEFGWVEGAPAVVHESTLRTGPGWITNQHCRIEATPGAREIRIFRNDAATMQEKGLAIPLNGTNGKHSTKAHAVSLIEDTAVLRGLPMQSVFGDGGISAVVYEDPWGSWGGMTEEPDSFLLHNLQETWSILASEVRETGPLRAVLWVRLGGERSRIDLTFTLHARDAVVHTSARVFWNERSARLKLCFPVGDQAEFEVPGATVTRGPAGEVPGGRWVRVPDQHGAGFGFASDALYNFDTFQGTLRATVVRSSRFADDVPTAADQLPWRPASDSGELTFRFLLTDSSADLPRLAEELEQEPIALNVSPHQGSLGKSGSLATLYPECIRMLALKRAETGSGFILRAQAPADFLGEAALNWLGHDLSLGELTGGQIISWRLEHDAVTQTWSAVRVPAYEDSVLSPSLPDSDALDEGIVHSPRRLANGSDKLANPLSASI